jgi:hypothetical protein
VGICYANEYFGSESPDHYSQVSDQGFLLVIAESLWVSRRMAQSATGGISS